MSKQLTLLDWLVDVRYALNQVRNTRLPSAPNGSKDTYALAAQSDAIYEHVRQAQDLLDRSLSQWEDEEDSVQEEHAELIADLNKWMEKPL